MRRERNTIPSAPHINQANREVNGCMPKLTSGACNPIHTVGKRLPCSSLPSVRGDDGYDNDDDMHNASCRDHTNEIPKLRFNRVDVSKRMKHTVEQLRLVRENVSGILQTLGSSWSTVPNTVHSRPITTSESIEPKLYGRDLMMNNMIDDITGDKYCGKDLTVIPIVGSGGIGKTTLAQYIYHSAEVEKHFDVKVWICVSLDFNANKLLEEVEKYIPKADGERIGTAGELIGQRLKSKRFLLILDDIWKCCNEDEWKTLLLPFRKSQVKGNIIVVTTRFPALAEMVKTTNHPIELKGLDHKEFKELFLTFVFGDQKSRKDHTFLLETGDKIVGKLKGSPLAAKTVGRLLRNHLDLDYWTRVLESKEWEQRKGENDIMPALKLSYDYLLFNLQQCFSYCALFPEDYKFKKEELIRLWIGLDVLHSHGDNRRIEDTGESHLTELINQGFMKKEEKQDGTACYVIHDLLHELARKVSSHECLSIHSSSVISIQIPPSIRHISINIDDTSIKDRSTFNNCARDLSTLGQRLKVGKLRSLMLFGRHHGSFVKTFGDLFSEAKALRVVFLSEASYRVEDLLHNFYNLFHLHYLRIQMNNFAETRFPSNISRFYHLRVLEADCCDTFDLPRDMNNLINLRHFLVRDNEMHSGIFEVGKLKSLQELRRFVVRKESQGFELRQIGHLAELSGSLCIRNLENVEEMEEADEAKLIQKTCLNKLILVWVIGRATADSAREECILESLKPSSNLLHLSIRGHAGATCPSWIGVNLAVENLESLCLDGVAWKKFPPIGELWLVNEQGEEVSVNISDKKFQQLRRLELVKLPRLKKWVGDGPCQLFPHLEALIIQDCSELMELSLSHSTCCQQEANISWFPRLQELMIEDCPKLLSFPPIPWTQAPCSANIRGVGSAFEQLVCDKNYNSEYRLTFEAKDSKDSTLWNVLAFHNLIELKELETKRCPPLPLHQFKTLSSLKALNICDSSNIFLLAKGESSAEYQLPIERIHISRWGASGKELTQLLTHFPELSELLLSLCEKITGLGVVEQQATSTLASSSSASKLEDEAQVEQHQQQDARGEEEIAASALPPQLQKLVILGCPELSLRSNPLDDDKEAGRAGGGGGLQGLRSLRSLTIEDCPKFLSSYSSSSSSFCFPFPNSLEDLSVYRVEGVEMLLPASNLSSLTSLYIRGCGDLRGEGLWPLIAQGHLTELTVFQTPNFFAGSEPSQPHEQETPSRSPKLQLLLTDDVAGVLTAPICTLLSSSLTELYFREDKEVERFTPEQEEALQSLTSLKKIGFWGYNKLQCLPAGLHRLPNLKRLYIDDCAAILSLPKDGLPSSLQLLRITRCPAIQSLPKVEDLPSSLRVLDVRDSESEELRRQCGKLIGTIPIVYA